MNASTSRRRGGVGSTGIGRGRALVCAGIALALGLTLPGTASAQRRRPTPRRQAPIVIRGQVPTPQVVTVRPREVPTYSRQVLVPRFYDHDFWPDIQEGYSLMPNRLLAGVTLAEAVPVDSIGTPDLFRLPTVAPPTPLRTRFGFIRKQLEWCAPHWWCPTRRVRIPMPADSAALFQMAPVIPPSAAPPSLPQPVPSNVQGIQQVQRWCTPHWWCPPGGVIRTTPPAATPTPAPTDTTRRTPPADSTRRPPGTPPALRQR